MAEVSLQNLEKVYPNGFQAIYDLNLDIANGEFLVLVGPSGCGKSTALRMVAGLETITSGTLTIAGEPMNDVEPKDRNVAMVFQNYALYPHLDKTETTTTRTTHHSPTRERIRHHPLDKPTTKTTNPSPAKTGSKAGLVVGS
ncbi:MAG: ATP-binding cassette domain-containing protein [Acidimicrobiales bacterium]|nr:ATP-binding cassette domain-containing protein [Acidimicrobiales bacterium]